jgi:hypothetical protein
VSEGSQKVVIPPKDDNDVYTLKLR